MSEERIRKQLVDLDFPNLCRLIVTAEVHPRCIALCHDGKEYAVTIHEKLCNRAKVYYHGSKAVCIGGIRLRLLHWLRRDKVGCEYQWHEQTRCRADTSARVPRHRRGAGGG